MGAKGQSRLRDARVGGTPARCTNPPGILGAALVSSPVGRDTPSRRNASCITKPGLRGWLSPPASRLLLPSRLRDGLGFPPFSHPTSTSSGSWVSNEAFSSVLDRSPSRFRASGEPPLRVPSNPGPPPPTGWIARSIAFRGGGTLDLRASHWLNAGPMGVSGVGRHALVKEEAPCLDPRRIGGVFPRAVLRPHNPQPPESSRIGSLPLTQASERPHCRRSHASFSASTML